MDEPTVMTAEELERLPLSERQRLAADAMVTDLSAVSPEFVERARQRGREILEDRGIAVPPPL
jgi:hypothetical protein